MHLAVNLLGKIRKFNGYLLYQQTRIVLRVLRLFSFTRMIQISIMCVIWGAVPMFFIEKNKKGNYF